LPVLPIKHRYDAAYFPVERLKFIAPFFFGFFEVISGCCHWADYGTSDNFMCYIAYGLGFAMGIL